MKSIKTIVLGAALMAIFGFSVAAQAAAPRAYYVRADGDDENNNGRSEAAPFKTVNKAVEMAKMGVIKTIIVIGTIGDSASISGAGNDEILVTGKADASEAEKAVLRSGFSISARGSTTSKVRFTHITITRGGVSIRGYGTSVTMGTGVVIEGIELDRNGRGGYGVDTDEYSSPILTMTDNAMIRNCKYSGINGKKRTTVTLSGSASIMDNGGYGIEDAYSVTVTDSAVISGNKDFGISASTVNISGNVAIRDNGQYGISAETVSASGNAVVSGHKAMGISGKGRNNSNNGTVTISDQVTISNNGGQTERNRIVPGCGISADTVTMNGGKIINNIGNGGIIVGGTCTINGGEISGNSAKKGGGINMTAGELTIAGGTIKGNKAEYGAGIYVEKGTATQTGGEITGNEAEFVGGGVYVPLGATFNAKGGTVSDNTADDGGNNVFRQS